MDLFYLLFSEVQTIALWKNDTAGSGYVLNIYTFLVSFLYDTFVNKIIINFLVVLENSLLFIYLYILIT